ncbi:putative ribonuclease H protein [Senna tora]|uniref:Putative ribonuclease H protein n=1 Tax=Senna tora TaxID=362788 RepID=A0A834SKA7_9FABA|nr:putative ribonuclease H protein [Senna tora]
MDPLDQRETGMAVPRGIHDQLDSHIRIRFKANFSDIEVPGHFQSFNHAPELGMQNTTLANRAIKAHKIVSILIPNQASTSCLLHRSHEPFSEQLPGALNPRTRGDQKISKRELLLHELKYLVFIFSTPKLKKSYHLNLINVRPYSILKFPSILARNILLQHKRFLLRL